MKTNVVTKKKVEIILENAMETISDNYLAGIISSAVKHVIAPLNSRERVLILKDNSKELVLARLLGLQDMKAFNSVEVISLFKVSPHVMVGFESDLHNNMDTLQSLTESGWSRYDVYRV